MLPPDVVDHSTATNKLNFVVQVSKKAHESPGNSVYNIDFVPIKKYVEQKLDSDYNDEEKEMLIEKWESLSGYIYTSIGDAAHCLLTNVDASEVYKILHEKLEDVPLFFGGCNQFVNAVASWRINIQR